jgi:hypothetical protein
MKHSSLGFDEKVAEQNVAYDIALFDGDQGHNHRSIVPQAIDKLCFRLSFEGRAVQLSHGIVVVGNLFTDDGHCDSQV